VLGEFGAGVDFVALEADKPAVVADVDEPVNLLFVLVVECEFSDQVGDGGFITNDNTEFIISGQAV